jgi:hypothetical protein
MPRNNKMKLDMMSNNTPLSLSTAAENQMILPDVGVKLFDKNNIPFRHIKDEDFGLDLHHAAKRLGFPHFENPYVDDPGIEMRQETRSDATVKAEKVISIFRRNMNERCANLVMRRLGLYAMKPRHGRRTVTRFFDTLKQIMTGAGYTEEFGYIRAYLCGKDIELAAIDSTSLLNPTHPLYDDCCRVIMVHCRRICTSMFMKHTLKFKCSDHSSLPKMKHQLSAVLALKGWSAMEGYCGILKTQKAASSKHKQESFEEVNNNNNNEEEEEEEFDTGALEYDITTFENDLAVADSVLQVLREAGLTPHEVEKVLSILVAFVKTGKAHRFMLQDVTCEIQQAAPNQSLECMDTWMAPLLSYLSSGYGSLEMIRSDPVYKLEYEVSKARNEAFLRLLLDARMRTSHIYIQGLDEEMVDRNLAMKSDAERRLIRTCALNLASVLNETSFHALYSRFVRHKVTWRTHAETTDDSFLTDAREILPRECKEMLTEQLRRVGHALTLEALTISRLHVLNHGRHIRATARIESPRPLVVSKWLSSHTVFYSNAAAKTSHEAMQASLRHIGPVKNILMFEEPRVNLAPRMLLDNENVSLRKQDDQDTFLKGKNRNALGKKHPKKRQRMTNNNDHDNDQSLSLDMITRPSSFEMNDDDDLDDEDADFASVLMDGTVITSNNDDNSNNNNNVVASERKSRHGCVVEFETQDARDRALMPALKIFGVMVPGETENRALFSLPASTATVVTFHSIPFCMRIGAVMDHVAKALGPNMTLKVWEHNDNASFLPDLLITDGTFELKFKSYDDAAIIMDRMLAYLTALPDPKVVVDNHASDMVTSKGGSSIIGTTTGMREFAAKTVEKRLRRDKEKRQEKDENTIPDVVLNYADANVTYRPFEVSWLPVRRGSKVPFSSDIES